MSEVIERWKLIDEIYRVMDDKSDEVLMKLWETCFPETQCRIYRFGESFEISENVSRIQQNKRDSGQVGKRQSDISSVEKMQGLP